MLRVVKLRHDNESENKFKYKIDFKITGSCRHSR